MSKKDTGGPASPVENAGSVGALSPGMTLRDYFAAHAPQPSQEAINTEIRLDKARNPYNEPHKPRLRDQAEIIAHLRYEYADAMLAERAK